MKQLMKYLLFAVVLNEIVGMTKYFLTGGSLSELAALYRQEDIPNPHPTIRKSMARADRIRVRFGLPEMYANSEWRRQEKINEKFEKIASGV